MATGYNVDGSAAPLIDLGWISPAGQMFSSTRDLDIVSLHVTIIIFLYYVLVLSCSLHDFL